MRKTLALIASATLLGFSLAAHADTFSYTLTSPFPGLGFSFTSSSLITASIDVLTSTSPAISNLTCTNAGSTCNSLSFVLGNGNNDSISFASPGGTYNRTGLSDSFFTLGTHTVGLDTLTIVVNPSAVAATPEPSSLALLGTGILGVFGAARRRFLKA